MLESIDLFIDTRSIEEMSGDANVMYQVVMFGLMDGKKANKDGTHFMDASTLS
jgi:hypothetical protein